MKDAWREGLNAGRGGPIGRALLSVVNAHVEQSLGGKDNTARLEALKTDLHAAIAGAIEASLSTLATCHDDRQAIALDIVAMYLDEAGRIFIGAARDFAEKSYQMQQRIMAGGASEPAQPWN